MRLGKRNVAPSNKKSTKQPDLAKKMGAHFRRQQKSSPFVQAAKNKQSADDNHSQLSNATGGTKQTAKSAKAVQLALINRLN